MHNPKPLKLAFLTDWLQVSSFSEFSMNLVEEMYRLGHKVFIVAPEFDDTHIQVPGREDGEGVLRFDKSEDPDKIVQQLKDWDVSHLFVHLECFSDHRKLENLIQQFGKLGKTSYLFQHSENYIPRFRYGLFNSIILPSRIFNKIPPGNSRLIFVDQGIPEFKDLDFDPERENQYRIDFCLPRPNVDKEDIYDKEKEGYILNTLDGKTNVVNVLAAINSINQYKQVDKKVYLQVHCANQNNIPRYLDLEQKEEAILVSLNYADPFKLAQCFAYSEGAIFVYPPMKEKQTSAALRFCIGAHTPIITNNGNHIRDLDQRAVMTLCNNESPEAIKRAIVEHFSRLNLRRSSARKMHPYLIKEKGWSVIAKQLEDILTNNPVKRYAFR